MFSQHPAHSQCCWLHNSKCATDSGSRKYFSIGCATKCCTELPNTRPTTGNSSKLFDFSFESPADLSELCSSNSTTGSLYIRIFCSSSATDCSCSTYVASTKLPSCIYGTSYGSYGPVSSCTRSECTATGPRHSQSVESAAWSELLHTSTL